MRISLALVQYSSPGDCKEALTPRAAISKTNALAAIMTRGHDW